MTAIATIIPLFWFAMALALGALALVTFHRIPAPGARGLTFLLISTSFWCLADAGVHLFRHEYLFTQLSYPPTVVTPVALFVLALDYRMQLPRLTRMRLAALLVIPAISVAAAWTNGSHGWIWTEFVPQRVHGLVHLHASYGPWFWVMVSYSYLLNAAASVMILKAALRSGGPRRAQALALLAGVALPWLVNFKYLLRLPPAPSLDLTSLSISVSCVLFAAGMLRFRLFNVIPIAYDAVIHQMPDGVVILDPHGRLLDANPAAAALLGILESDAGRPARQWVSTADGRKRLLDLTEFGTFPVSISSNASCHHFALTVWPLLVRGNRVGGRVLVFRDETARRLQEEALLVSRAATAEANRRLRAANEELKAAIEKAEALARKSELANEAKSEFLAAISHEIRTPMNAVLGAVEILDETAADAAQREYVGMIRNAGRTLLSLLNNVLDLSKAEAGKMELDPRPCNLLNVVHQAVEVMSEAAARKELAVEVEAAPGFHPWRTADRTRLWQVVMNLVSNAVKFTQRGEVTIRVAETNGGGWVRIEVEDSGVGIAPEARGRLFQPFLQAGATTAHEFGGTGLGLAIAKRLVELMGGQIGCESVPGEGSMFWFEAPLPACSPEEPATGAEPSAPPRGMRVLLVEDNAVNARVAEAMLTSLGARVSLARSGSEAIDQFCEQTFDLVLMDLQMPGLGGIPATRLIREQESALGRRRTPIVALTASVLNGERQECRSAGMDGFLSKPITKSELAGALSTWATR